MPRTPIVVSTQLHESRGYAITCVVDSATDETIEDIVSIARQSNSRGLLLPGAELTAVGISAVRHFPELRYLSLERSTISDESLTALGSMKSLETLSLAKTRISGEAFAELELPSITLLDLCETAVTDHAVTHLLRFPSLGTVRLSNTHITLAALSTLGKLPKLGIVWAQGNRINVFDLANASFPAKLQVMV